MKSQKSDWASKPLLLPLQSQTSAAPAMLRDDCWSKEATRTLIEEWGDRCLSAESGNLRQQQWQEVANALNRRHGSSCTDQQCKSRIGTLKKRYKAEKVRVLGYRKHSCVSTWPFFSALDALIGNHFPANNSNSSPLTSPSRKIKNPSLSLSVVPVRPRSQKRFPREYRPDSLPPAGRYVFQRRDECTSPDSVSMGSGSSGGTSRRIVGPSNRGYAELASTVTELAEIYERVETWKVMEMVEMEKTRIQFSEDMEKQRMRGFMEMQSLILKMKKPKFTSMVDCKVWFYYNGGVGEDEDGHGEAEDDVVYGNAVSYPDEETKVHFHGW